MSSAVTTCISLLFVGSVLCGCARTVTRDAGDAPDTRVDTSIDTRADTRDTNTEAGLAPIAIINADETRGADTLVVHLDAAESYDPDGAITRTLWTFPDGSRSLETRQRRRFGPGCHRVRLTVEDDSGLTARAELSIRVAPARESGGVRFITAPSPGALFPRNRATQRGSVRIAGHIPSGFIERHVDLVRESDGEIISRDTGSLCDPGGLAFDVSLRVPAERETYAIRITGVRPDRDIVLEDIGDLVSGDVIVINGQSNAVARSFDGDANINAGTFLRSYGTLEEDPDDSAADREWHRAVGNNGRGRGHIGQWAMRMGRLLIDRHGIPLAIVNGGRGAQEIAYFQRDDALPDNLETNYGRLLTRMQRAGLAEDVRAVLFYQGESDREDGEAHARGVTSLHEDWRADFPGVERFYLTQTRKGCGGPSSIPVREAQRQLARRLPRTALMTTTGIDAHDGCHFAYDNGYATLGERYADLLGRDLYASGAGDEVEPPDIARVQRVSEREVHVTLSRPQTLTVDDGIAASFRLAGTLSRVVEVEASDDGLRVRLDAPVVDGDLFIYDGHAGPGPWIRSAAGLGLPTFSATL